MIKMGHSVSFVFQIESYLGDSVKVKKPPLGSICPFEGCVSALLETFPHTSLQNIGVMLLLKFRTPIGA